MSWLPHLRQALRSLFHRQAVERELDAELRTHLEMQAEIYVHEGLDPAEARRRARLKLGGTEQVKEGVRESWYGAGIDSLWRDVRFGARVLHRQPGFTAVAVLTLGLGIGATTAIFSLVNGVLLRPLAYREPEQLAMIRVDLPSSAGYPGLSKAELREFDEQGRLFEGFGAAVGFTISLTAEGQMEQVPAATITEGLFPLLGVTPAQGRGFGPEDRYTERRAYRSVLISHGLWQRRFGADPTAIGRSLEVNNVPRTIIGVMPQGFRLLLGPGTHVDPDVDIWVPAALNDDFLHVHAWRTLARLRAGVTFAQAEEELQRLGEWVVEKYPDVFENERVVFHAAPLHGDLVQNTRPALLALFGAVAFLLLIACANVTNLLLTHTEGRRRELAVRAALGAGRARILRQLLMENGLLALTGGAVGLLFARWGLRLFLSAQPEIVRHSGEIRVDTTVLGFAVVVALLTSLVVGLLPAFHACRSDPSEVVRERGGGTGRDGRGVVRNTLVIAEIAVSLILLIGAGLMSRTLVGLLRVDVGFDPSGVLTLNAPVNAEAYDTPEACWKFYQRVLQTVAALPGVEAVGGIRRLPLGGPEFAASYAYDDETERTFGTRTANYDWVLPGYFRSIGIPVLAGRGFSDADNESERLVVVVDESLARQAWPDRDAVGQRLMVDAEFGRDDRQWVEVVGVVRHVRTADVRVTGGPQIYLPYSNLRTGGTNMAVTVRTSGDPASHASMMRREIEALGGGRPVHSVRELRDLASAARADSRFVLWLMGAFAASALVMSLIGTYGVIRYSASQRIQEIGIRSALGATGPDIVRLVLGQGVWLIAIGLGVGLVGAVAITGLLQSLLFDVTATDPGTFAVVTLFLSAMALLACYIPARRAARVDPLATLRCD